MRPVCESHRRTDCEGVTQPRHPAGHYSIGHPRGSEEFTERFGCPPPHNFVEDQMQQARTRSRQLAGLEVAAGGSQRRVPSKSSATPLATPPGTPSTLERMSPPSRGFGSRPSSQLGASRLGWCLAVRGQTAPSSLAQANLDGNMSMFLSKALSAPNVASPKHTVRAEGMFSVSGGAMQKVPRLKGTLLTTAQLYGARQCDAEPVDNTWKDKAALRTSSSVVF